MTLQGLPQEGGKNTCHNGIRKGLKQGKMAINCRKLPPHQ